MRRLFALILIVLNLVLLQAQGVRFISVNSADTTLENIAFKKLPKLLQSDTLRPDTLTTPTKWMVKLQKKLTKEQRQDSNIYIFFCPSAKDSVKVYLPLRGKYGYVLFDKEKAGVKEIAALQERLCMGKYQWDAVHDPQWVAGWLEDEGEGESVADAETKAFMNRRIYDKVLKTKYSIKDFWTEGEKLKIIKDINSQIFKLFYIKSEVGSYSWDYARFYADKKIDPKNFDPKTASEELRKEHEREYSLANYVIKNYTGLLLKSVDTYQTGFNEFVKYFYDTKKAELGGDIFKYQWIENQTGEIMDPRVYYKNGSYDFTKFENDVKEYVFLKDPKYINPVDRENETAKLTQYNMLLSMYAQYMYIKGVDEIPGISVSSINTIKNNFYKYWDKSETEQWGYHWEWKELNTDRIESERQEYLARLRGEAALQQYLLAIEEGRFGAIADITIGSAEIVGTAALIYFFPPAGFIEISLTGFSSFFAAEQIVGGVNTLNAINKGLFDPNKEYKYVKGLIIDEYGDKAATIYDFASIFVGVTSATGEVLRITKIKGDDLERVLRAYSAGIGTIDTGSDIYELKKK